MDSLTAWHLARELDARWHGRRMDGGRFDREARAVTLMVDSRSVRFELHNADVPDQSITNVHQEHPRRPIITAKPPVRPMAS